MLREGTDRQIPTIEDTMTPVSQEFNSLNDAIEIGSGFLYDSKSLGRVVQAIHLGYAEDSDNRLHVSYKVKEKIFYKRIASVRSNRNRPETVLPFALKVLNPEDDRFETWKFAGRDIKATYPRLLVSNGLGEEMSVPESLLIEWNVPLANEE